MSHPSKRKGDSAELEAARLLADRTGWPVRRKLGAGRADDTGDLAGVPECCVQVKSYKDVTRSVRETLDELPAQQANAGTPYAFGLIRRPGGRWFAVLDLDNLCALLREATEPEWDSTMLADPEWHPPMIASALSYQPPKRQRNHPTRRDLRKRASIE